MGFFTDECYEELGLGAPELIFTRRIAVQFLLPTLKVGFKEIKHFKTSKKKNVTGNIFNGIDRK